MICRALAKLSWFAFALIVMLAPARGGNLEYPLNNAEFNLQVPGDFRTKASPDGSIVGVGAKIVIALTAMSGIESKDAAKKVLPKWTKDFFLQTLQFQQLEVQTTVDNKIQQEDLEREVTILAASGKNSDGRMIAITATAFASDQGRYFVFITAARPEDIEEASKISRQTLATLRTVGNEED
jgi:hypothetical protein